MKEMDLEVKMNLEGGQRTAAVAGQDIEEDVEARAVEDGLPSALLHGDGLQRCRKQCGRRAVARRGGTDGRAAQRRVRKLNIKATIFGIKVDNLEGEKSSG